MRSRNSWSAFVATKRSRKGSFYPAVRRLPLAVQTSSMAGILELIYKLTVQGLIPSRL